MSHLHRKSGEFDGVSALHRESSSVDQEQDANIALSELDKGKSLNLYCVIPLWTCGKWGAVTVSLTMSNHHSPHIVYM